MSAIEVGVRAPRGLLREGPERLAAFGAAVEAAGIDRIWIGDHISFKGGQGEDGLLNALALLTATRRVTVQTAVYLLPLRHPVPVARQVAMVAELAGGRFVFGVGVGGEDPRETANCGVDPSTRGRRMDESLAIIRRLLAGETVDHHGTMFAIDGAAILPEPRMPVPIIVGGRSDAALRRAGRFGDGWLGVWVSPERFAANAKVVADAAPAGAMLQHGLLAWCGFGANRDAARAPLAAAMERFYRLPFERFEPSSPYGTPAEVADALAPYVDAGAASLLLAPVTDDLEGSLAAVADVRERLRSAS